MSTLKDQPTRAKFRRALAQAALGRVGVGENPPKSNLTEFGAWYGGNGQPWCAKFVSWCYWRASLVVGCENPLAGLQSAKGFAHCTSTYTRAKKWGIILAPQEPLMLGDVFIWAHSKSPLLSTLILSPGHTGLVTSVSPLEVTEGNTDPSYSRTGGNVMTHTHSRSDGRHNQLLAIYRPTRRYGR